MRRLAVGMMACVACDGATVAPDAQPLADAAPFVPGPNRLLVESWGSEPVYVRYRDGRGPWTTPELIGPSTYELFITDAYDFIAVCADDFGSDSARLKQTFSDGDASLACFDSSAFGPPQIPTHVAVTGDMVQAGDVFFYDYDYSQTGPWTFSLQVAPGTYDLIAVGNRHMVIRRDQTVTAPTTVARIDTVQEGVQLVAVPFSVNSEPGEEVRSSIWLDTFDGWAFIDGTSTDLLVPPASILAPGDVLEAEIMTTTPTTRRALATAYNGGQPSYTMMPMLTDLEFWHPDRTLYVTWTALPTFTYAAMWVFTFRASEGVEASPRWFEVTGATGLGVGDHPGDYLDAWVARPVNTHIRHFGLYENSGSIRRTSVHEERFGFGARTSAEERSRLHARLRARHDAWR